MSPVDMPAEKQAVQSTPLEGLRERASDLLDFSSSVSDRVCAKADVYSGACPPNVAESPPEAPPGIYGDLDRILNTIREHLNSIDSSLGRL